MFSTIPASDFQRRFNSFMVRVSTHRLIRRNINSSGCSGAITQHADALTSEFEIKGTKKGTKLYLESLHGEGLVLLKLVYFPRPEYVAYFLRGSRGQSWYIEASYNKITCSFIKLRLYHVVVVSVICIACLVFCFVCLQKHVSTLHMNELWLMFMYFYPLCYFNVLLLTKCPVWMLTMLVSLCFSSFGF